MIRADPSSRFETRGMAICLPSSSKQWSIVRQKVCLPVRISWQRQATAAGPRGGSKLIVAGSALADAGSDRPVPGADFLQVNNVSFRPPGTEFDLLDNVSMSLAEKRLGLVYGPSGSGKTTLLQVLGGLATPTAGSIFLGRHENEAPREAAAPASLSSRVGIVFQFPERYFLTDTIVEELLFGYSRQTQDIQMRQALTMRLQTSIIAVGISGIPLDMNPRALSDGYKRRLALAIQLVRLPEIILLDEPLAGLDWRARRDVLKLLTAVKKEKTVIVVSHDLREIAELVDKSWRMDFGGKLIEQGLPPDLQVPSLRK